MGLKKFHVVVNVTISVVHKVLVKGKEVDTVGADGIHSRTATGRSTDTDTGRCLWRSFVIAIVNIVEK